MRTASRNPLQVITANTRCHMTGAEQLRNTLRNPLEVITANTRCHMTGAEQQ